MRIVPIAIVLGLLVHFLLPRIDTIESSLQTLRAMRPWFIAIAIGFQVLSYFANGLLLQSIVVPSAEEAQRQGLTRTMSLLRFISFSKTRLSS